MLEKFNNKNSGDIRLCSKNACIEAGGRNAQLIVAAVTFTIACVGLYYLSRK